MGRWRKITKWMLTKLKQNNFKAKSHNSIVINELIAGKLDPFFMLCSLGMMHD